MRIDEINTRMTALDRQVKIRVMLPDGYERGDKNYPVMYVNDGQDLFRDDQTFWGAESLRFEAYYKDYARFLPHVILAAIEAPEDHALRTQQYSPYTKNFQVPPEKKFEPRIEGKGKEYLQWMTAELKPMIDRLYRTRPEPEYTAVCGYSTGGLISIYAALSYPQVFTRLIAMSSAVCIWMDCLEKTLETGSYSHFKYIYMDVGTNEFGRMTTREEFLQGADQLYHAYLSHGVDPGRIKYNQYPDAVHSQREWRGRFPDALRWVFQDCE